MKSICCYVVKRFIFDKLCTSVFLLVILCSALSIDLSLCFTNPNYIELRACIFGENLVRETDLNPWVT